MIDKPYNVWYSSIKETVMSKKQKFILFRFIINEKEKERDYEKSSEKK